MGLQNVDVVILAGGLGTRLRSLVSDRSKVLAEVNGRPFIFFLLDQLVNAGCKNIILCTGYLGDHLEDTVGNSYKNIKIEYSKEETPLGTGGALRRVAGMIKSDNVLIMNGDSFANIDLQDFMCSHMQSREQLSIVVVSGDNAGACGRIKLSFGGKIAALFKKQSGRTDSCEFINGGIYLMQSSILKTLPNKEKFSLELDFLSSFTDKEIMTYNLIGKFIDIGTPESLRKASMFFDLINVENS